MSIDERLRSGLAANTDHLGDGQLDRELARVFGRAHHRRRARIAGAAVAGAAMLGLVAWRGGLPGFERGSGLPEPVQTPKLTVVTPRSMAGLDGPLEAGPWIVPMWGPDSDILPRALVEVPAGYGSPGGWVVDRGADGDPQNYGTVSFWTVQEVLRDPCEGVTTDDPGPGVQDLARALRAQTGTVSTNPRSIRVDGHDGVYLEIRLPVEQAELTGCHLSRFTLWRSNGQAYYGGDIAGTVVRLSILDVDGTRVVMVVDTTPREDAAATTQVLGIAASVHFLPPLRPAR